jgi:transposase
VTQKNLFEPLPLDRYEILTKEELIILAREHQKIITTISKDNDRLRAIQNELEQKSFFINEQLVTIKNKLYGTSSERSEHRKQSSNQKSNSGKKRILLPSERYPNVPLIERHITLDQMPSCGCCGHGMIDSGMTEDSEYLTKVPAQYYVVVQMRHKYRCGKCHGDIVTAPTSPRITEGGGYSDEMIIDTAVSKYCDLIPIERLAAMAGREGIKNLPPQSLIEGTHQLADYIRSAYNKLKNEMLVSTIWHADETPHRMLEGDTKCSWFLWGFSTTRTSYFECHATRSGDVASELLINSACEYLVSDVYSGYNKAITETNKVRKNQNKPLIVSQFCNAHARRYFKKAADSFPQESVFYLNQFKKIYRLESIATKYPDKKSNIRLRLRKYFEKIKTKCLFDAGGYSDKSSLGKAINYFLKNYIGFTRFIDNPKLPIDNNPAERLLRSPVVGRKNWYGTHSKRGADTSAVLFSLIESCKLNHVNPREYLKNLVQDLHQGKSAFTPSEFKDLTRNQ